MDCSSDEIEIVISEDCSPQKKLTYELVSNFIVNTEYKVNYHENEKNLGFDGNLRRLIELSNGDFVLFMGDDDLFIKNRLNL